MLRKRAREGGADSAGMLPAGFERIDGELRINVDKFEPGMAPQVIETPYGVAYADETGVRIETHSGDVHHQWRDGQTESQLRHIKAVAIGESLQVERSERNELVHGYVLIWYMVPSGSLHVTFDAKGNLDEVTARGLETHTSPDGVLTVERVVGSSSANQ